MWWKHIIENNNVITSYIFFKYPCLILLKVEIPPVLFGPLGILVMK
jgi:hypothetical protein